VVVVLAGGTGGAKLAAGFHELLGPELTVVANTGDDVEVHGVHVSPDPDLVTYRLAGMLDERGWGIAGDTWSAMDGFAAAGRETWFRLGDRDLALCLVRTELLRQGVRLTEAHAAVVQACGVDARVLPASDDPVRTHVRSRGEWVEFQRFMIVEGAAAPIEAVEFRGANAARPAPDVLDAIASAEAIVIGPSNPIISIGPILAVPGIREALEAAPARLVAVSPFVGGRAVKGPTEAFMAHAGQPCSAAGVAALYGADAVVGDDPTADHVTDTLMPDRAAARRLAAETLDFASKS
jgi:LPPG:FO 2-phospho-L-lactate transferase